MLCIRVRREVLYLQVPVELSKGDADYRDAFRTPDSGKLFQVLGPMRSHHNILHPVPELCYTLMVNVSRFYSQNGARLGLISALSYVQRFHYTAIQEYDLQRKGLLHCCEKFDIMSIRTEKEKS